MNRRLLSLPALLVTLLLAGCGMSGEPPSGGPSQSTNAPFVVSEGVERTQAVPTAVVNGPAAPAAALVSAAAPAGPPRNPPGVAVPRPRRIPRITDGVAGEAPPTPQFPSASNPLFAPASFPASGAPLAPATNASFIGLIDNNSVIPPDTMGAAGPNHLVSILNSEVGFFSKAGAKLNPSTSLSAFWSPLISANHLPIDVFDPKVIYDPGIGRFIAATLDGRLPTDNASWILLAVSQTSDPTVGWNTWAIPADNTLITWADFTGLGIDNSNVFVTANMFTSTDAFQTGKIWRIPKPQLLPSPQSASLTWTEFTDPAHFTLQPAYTFGAPSSEFFITEENGTSTLSVLAVTGSSPALVSLGSVTVASYPLISVSSPLPVAPQDNVDTGDTRILNVVYRNGHLYATHTVSNTPNTKTEVAWYEINPSTSPPTLIQQGRVSDTTRFYYYPSIAVNRNGDIAIGFSGSSPTEFPGGYYTARLFSDASGFTQPVGLLKAGEARYFKTFGLATDSNRWGDYSATVVDPTDDLTFWTLQEYARPTAGTFPNTGRWGTWWGSFLFTDILAPDNVIATLLSDNSVRLTWNDRATNDIAYVVQRKTGAGGTFATIAPLPSNSVTYTDNSVLSAGTTYFYRVGAVSASSTAYSTEVQITIPSPPAAGGGGGGGGSCAMVPVGRAEPFSGDALAAVLPFVLPCAALALRRSFRKYFRAGSFRHPAC